VAPPKSLKTRAADVAQALLPAASRLIGTLFGRLNLPRPQSLFFPAASTPGLLDVTS